MDGVDYKLFSDVVGDLCPAFEVVDSGCSFEIV
jgi:hypothetical protein